jgi:hypothetical protein
MEVTLRALREAGLNELDSVRTYFLLVGFTLSQAAYQTRGPVPALEPPEQVRAERLAERGYGTIERLQLPSTWDFDETFEFGISLVLNGVEATMRRRVPGPGLATPAP